MFASTTTTPAIITPGVPAQEQRRRSDEAAGEPSLLSQDSTQL